MTSPLPAIDARNLRLALGEGDSAVEVLRGVDLYVPQGQTLAVVGPSGSGKSSLMAVLSGLERASSGSLRVAGQVDRLAVCSLFTSRLDEARLCTQRHARQSLLPTACS